MLQKQTQKLILSPQMQQAIKMLQIPLMELRALARQEMVTNPVLEENLSEEAPLPEESETPSAENETELDFREEFDNLTKLDDEWRDYFNQSGGFRKITQQDDEKRKFMLDSISVGESLQDHLLSQLGVIVTDPEKEKIGITIIGNIDNNGYLRSSNEELVRAIGKSPEEIEEIIHLIQTFDPVGVGARDIEECLLIQLDRLGKVNTLESRIVTECLDLMGEHKYEQIADQLQVQAMDVKKAITFIATLDPKPGLMFSQEESQYVVPDVFLERRNSEYIITLNDDKIPHLYISSLYRTLMRKKDTPRETINYIKNKIRSGSWLIRNITQRQQTISKIATAIVDVQREFFDEGPSFLKPLTMQTVANTVDLHESTVSRAIANKYMQTPQGTFQIKYFFSSGVKTVSGESLSVNNVKDQITAMVKEESKQKPLSDQDIIARLAQQGIRMARRTVAKYRQEMNMPASSVRKQK